ncbi:MAG: hypothetical protein AB7O65_01750 [Candidatus Korobacteraceae bacterium]
MVSTEESSAEATISILGVYKPEIPKSVYQEQWKVTGSDARTREHFESLVLIEAIANNVDEKFDLKDIGQTLSHPDFPAQFQCAYDEALLSADGNSLVDRRINCVHGTGVLRFAFYLHFYDPKRPLRWTYGQVECPKVQPVPRRLRNLVPYRACT